MVHDPARVRPSWSDIAKALHEAGLAPREIGALLWGHKSFPPDWLRLLFTSPLMPPSRSASWRERVVLVARYAQPLTAAWRLGGAEALGAMWRECGEPTLAAYEDVLRRRGAAGGGGAGGIQNEG